jgi:CheY-like chemotaxis protein
MGGRIWVQSMPGEGSCFQFELPLPASEAGLVAPLSEPPLEGRHFLVVDPQRPGQEFLLRCLRSIGATADVCADATEAIARLRSEMVYAGSFVAHAPDEIDVVQVARVIHEVPGRALLPVVACASMIDKPIISSSSAIAGILTAPIKHNHVLRVARQIVQPHQSTVAVPVFREKAASLLAPAEVLVVDDNELNRRVAAAILEKSGWKPDVVENGREAVVAAVHKAYDFILMDVNMPEMNGVDATREIRRSLTGKKQPVIIATTAGVAAGDRERCLAAGMNDYISKPVTADKLRRVLHLWQERRAAVGK